MARTQTEMKVCLTLDHYNLYELALYTALVLHCSTRDFASIIYMHKWFAPTLVAPLGAQQILYTPNVKTARNKDDKRALKCTQLVSLHGCLLCT